MRRRLHLLLPLTLLLFSPPGCVRLGLDPPKRDVGTQKQDGTAKKMDGPSASKKDRGNKKKDGAVKPPDKGKPADLTKIADKKWHDKWVPPACGVACAGCCQGTKCVGLGQQSVSNCGVGGSVCAPCPAPKACKTMSCTGGVCISFAVADGASCLAATGKCLNGSCCTGCQKNGKCLSGTSQTATLCGGGGTKCAACSTHPCVISSCVNQACHSANKSNGTACAIAGSVGQCTAGSCCFGCRKANVCHSGGANTLCGKEGVQCADCSTKTAPACNAYSCKKGKCVLTQLAAGTSCSSGGASGRCLNGKCCTGCINGSVCYAGTALGRCGKAGAVCATCPKAGICKVATCTAGKCGLTNLANGTACQSGLGACLGGSCCTGCVSGGSTCQAGNTVAYCGELGKACVTCKGGWICVSGACMQL